MLSLFYIPLQVLLCRARSSLVGRDRLTTHVWGVLSEKCSRKTGRDSGICGEVFGEVKLGLLVNQIALLTL